MTEPEPVGDIDPAMPHEQHIGAIPANRPVSPHEHPDWAQAMRDEHAEYLRESAAWLRNPDATALHSELGRRQGHTHAVHLLCNGHGGNEFRYRGWHRSGLSVVIAERDGVLRTRVTTTANERPGLHQAASHGGELDEAKFGVTLWWKCTQCGRTYRSTQRAILMGAATAINEGIRDGHHFAWRMHQETPSDQGNH